MTSRTYGAGLPRWLFRRALVVALCLVHPGLAAAATTVVTLTFDDGFADNYQAAQILASRGLMATFFLNSGRIGLPGFLTEGEVLAIRAAGHEIGGHTVTHTDLPTVDDDEKRRQICDDRAAFMSRGLPVTSLAYPYADADLATERIARECGYNSARTVGGIKSAGTCLGCPYAETIPPTNPYYTTTPDSMKQWSTLADAQRYVTQAEENGGGWVQLVFHHVCDGCDPYSTPPALLAELADWLLARGSRGTVVKTVHEVIGGAVAPAVAGPPPAVRANTANLLVNASLEEDQNPADSVPDCWQRGGFGTNTASWTRTSDAYDGSFAERVDVTSYVSGARRLVSRQDLGSCAPPVQLGHSYAASAWYKATAPVRWVAYVRTESGGWVWFAQSSLLPAASTWTEAPWVTPPAPPNATALSVGLSIYSAGSVTVDALKVSDADASPPVVTLVSPADAAIVQGTITLAATATDDGGIAEVEFLLDGVVIGSVSSSPFTMPFDTTTVADAKASITARARDEAGNVASVSREVTVANAPPPDGVPPAVAVVSPVTGARVAGTVWLTADATDDRAVQHVAFLVNGELVATAFEAPFTAEWDSTRVANGPATLVARAVDTSGNTSSAQVSIYVDQTNPTLRIVSPAEDAQLSGVVQLEAVATDGLGIEHVEFLANGAVVGIASGDSLVASLDTMLLPNGPVEIEVVAYDHGGQQTSSAQVTATVLNLGEDTSAPVTTAECDGVSCTSSWYTASVSVSLRATDAGGSGIAGTFYAIDGGAPVAYAQPFLVSSSADVTFWSVDGEGNTEAVNSVAIGIDRLAPSTTATCDGVSCGGRWFTAPVAVSLDASDGGSGVEATRWSTDGTAPDLTSTAYTGPFTVSESATLHFRSWDVAGNAESPRSANVRIDAVAPATVITCDGAPCSDAWRNKPVAIVLQASDAGSGVASIRYSLDGSDPLGPSGLAYTGPFAVTQTATVSFASVDVAGNREASKKQSIRIDTTPPWNVSVTAPADGSSVTGNAVWFWAAGQDDVGLYRVRFYLDGKQLGTRVLTSYRWVWDTTGVPKGLHKLHVRAEDAAGNGTNSAPITVTVY